MFTRPPLVPNKLNWIVNLSRWNSFHEFCILISLYHVHISTLSNINWSIPKIHFHCSFLFFISILITLFLLVFQDVYDWEVLYYKRYWKKDCTNDIVWRNEHDKKVWMCFFHSGLCLIKREHMNIFVYENIKKTVERNKMYDTSNSLLLIFTYH